MYPMHTLTSVRSDTVDCSLQGFSVHGILQARILEWVAMPFFRESSRPRDRTQLSCASCNAGGLLTAEPPGKQIMYQNWVIQNEVTIKKKKAYLFFPTLNYM